MKPSCVRLRFPFLLAVHVALAFSASSCYARQTIHQTINAFDVSNFPFRTTGDDPLRSLEVTRGESATPDGEILSLPAPWTTWGAYILHVLLLVTLLLLSRREIIKRKQVKAKNKLRDTEALKMHETDQLRTRFFANASHEFRTPLTILTGLLEKYSLTAHTDAERSDFVMMQRNANRLISLVSQLSDISRLEAGSMKLDLKAGDLHSCIARIISQFCSIAESRKIILEFHGEPSHAMFDRDKLEKIIVNLLANAFKFTSDGGSIIVRLSTLDHSIRIEVSDSGIGNAPGKLERIFDRFYHADDSNIRDHEEFGIELHLVRELVGLHQGSISVKSTRGEGTNFTLLIPYIPVDKITEEMVINPRIQKASHLPDVVKDAFHQIPEQEMWRVLVVEDNADGRGRLSKVLSDYYHVLNARDGDEGFAIAAHHVPDLIVSDLMMPTVEGTELCRKIKDNKKTSHIPVILLTAKVDPEARIRAFDSGADDYLAGPFNVSELRSRIDNLIHSRIKLRKIFSTALIVMSSDHQVVSLNDRFLRKVVETIEVHIGDPLLCVNSIAKAMAMSPVQLYRKLKSLTGHSPNELVRSMRLERAASLLHQKGGSVTDVAFAVGFQNMSYFTKCFKEKFGNTPSEFLKKKVIHSV